MLPVLNISKYPFVPPQLLLTPKFNVQQLAVQSLTTVIQSFVIWCNWKCFGWHTNKKHAWVWWWWWWNVERIRFKMSDITPNQSSKSNAVVSMLRVTWRKQNRYVNSRDQLIIRSLQFYQLSRPITDVGHSHQLETSSHVEVCLILPAIWLDVENTTDGRRSSWYFAFPWTSETASGCVEVSKVPVHQKTEKLASD